MFVNVVMTDEREPWFTQAFLTWFWLLTQGIIDEWEPWFTQGFLTWFTQAVVQDLEELDS